MGGRDLAVLIVGTVTWGCYECIIISFLFTRVKMGVYSYAKAMLLLVTLTYVHKQLMIIHS